MTKERKPKTTPMPEGMRTFLDYWLYGVVKTAAELGNARVFLRAVQEDSIRKLIEQEGLRFGEDRDPEAVLEVYHRHLDSMGILDYRDIGVRAEGDGFRMSVGASCPYRSVCNWIHEEGSPPPCFRAVAVGEVLRMATRRLFDGRLVRFDVPCQITLKPLRAEATDDGD